ncbi:response regulator [Colwellia sp. MB3u-4]|uniref:response regulator n=1 Tax=Colwellia sp. MB3u-4 TaxID=2759822 RepID=UPI0015F70E35|nr:response regulator [Colwellia sp. MB3u-4]MBA6288161.1 response regulator [Colwellia sp. MB3u-4]
MLVENSKEQLLQRYNKSVIVVFSSIMLLTFIIISYNYYLARQDFRDYKLAKLSEYSAQLNNKLTGTVETLAGIRDLAEYYLRFPAELPSQPPSLRQEGQYFYLDKNRQNLSTNHHMMSGNITGVGRIDTFNQSLLHELTMANALTPAFVTAKKSIKEANWLYYISMQRFVNLYPWVPRSIWQYNDQSLSNELMLKIKTSKHKDEKLWARPYVDSASKGLNTMLGMGVYLDHEMKGAVLIDMNTAGLYNYLPEVSEVEHGYIIVDKQSHVLLHKNNSNLPLNAQTAFSDTAPSQLNQFSYQSLLNIMPSAEIGDWVVQQQKLVINDWILLEYHHKESFYTTINQRFLSILISISFGFLSLLVVVYYVTYRLFIGPSKKFIRHIEHCSAGDPGKIKPSAEWRHWFKIVEDLFGQNRSLMQRLKDQNIELDSRVKEKTQALSHKSEQHQRDYALLRSVMDAIPDYILFNDQQGALIGCNQAVEKRVLRKEVDILGDQINDFIAADISKKVAQNISQSQRGHSFVAHHQTVPTEHNTYEIYQAPFYGVFNELLGSIILIRDVTEQFKINQALQRAKNQAEEANQIKSQFLANMSHEIRTPINAMQGMFFLLQQTRLNKAQEQYLGNAQTASNTLLYLVNELLDSAKVESGNMSVHKELTGLESIVSQALNLNIGALVGKELSLSVAIDSQVPLDIHTDTMRLVQVLSNLLNNAIKFTERGKVALSVSLSCPTTEPVDAKNIAVLFTVKDTGIGIEKSKQTGLFEAFKQADESMTRVYGGTGLGLSICQHIAHLLGGKITIDSVLGQGAEFTLALPMDAPNMPVCDTGYSAHCLTKFRPQFSTSTVLNLSVNIPEKLRENFTDIAQSVIDISSFSALKTVDAKADKILLIDSSKYPQDLLKSELDIIKQEVAVLALCQPIASVISAELLEQLNRNSINYLLLEMPLYRNVIAKLAEELCRLSSHGAIMDNKMTTNRHELDAVQPKVGSLAGLKVLLVEDNLVNQLVAVKLLQSMQAQVTVAQNGQEALEKLPLENIDIVLMDIQMPIMDGLTATKHIRAQPQYNRLPIIAMTAHAREEDKQQCLAAGMNLHIAKPISLKVLRDSILSQLVKTPK